MDPLHGDPGFVLGSMAATSPATAAAAALLQRASTAAPAAAIAAPVAGALGAGTISLRCLQDHQQQRAAAAAIALSNRSVITTARDVARDRVEAALSLGASAMAGSIGGIEVPAPSTAFAAALTQASASTKKSYEDASARPDPTIPPRGQRKSRGGVTEPFPEKLHRLLAEAEAEGKEDVVGFFPHGRAFCVFDPDRFMEEIMPKYFSQSKLSSFQRQLNLYGFQRINDGPDAGGYYHELFLKGRPALCVSMRRVTIKSAIFGSKKVKGGAAAKAASNATAVSSGVTVGSAGSEIGGMQLFSEQSDQCPDFYSLPPIKTSNDAAVEDHETKKKCAEAEEAAAAAAAAAASQVALPLGSPSALLMGINPAAVQGVGVVNRGSNITSLLAAATTPSAGNPAQGQLLQQQLALAAIQGTSAATTPAQSGRNLANEQLLQQQLALATLQGTTTAVHSSPSASLSQLLCGRAFADAAKCAQLRSLQAQQEAQVQAKVHALHQAVENNGTGALRGNAALLQTILTKNNGIRGGLEAASALKASQLQQVFAASLGRGSTEATPDMASSSAGPPRL